MSSNMFEEIIRISLQTAGTEKAADLAQAFESIGKAAAASDPKAQALLDELERAARLDKAVNGIAGLQAKLQETGDQLFLAKNRAAELQKEFDSTLEPTKKLTRELERAKGEVSRLATEQNRQTAELQRAENVIRGAGIDLKQLARAQGDVRAQTAQAVTQAREYAKALGATATQAKASEGVFGRLRGAIAGVFAGLSLRGAAEGVKDIALLGDAAEKVRNQFANMYGSVAAGQKALAGLAEFAARNGLAIDAVQQAAVKLKTFGIDPLTGALQSMVDQNAAAGGSMDDLNGKLLALGQAWSKEKLQAEEALQLIERGVPVWQLLAQATGKSVAELQKLSEAGKLGRKEISLLIAEIGKMNSGAAAKNAGTLSGLFEQLTGRVREFFLTVANSGTLDYLKNQLGALNQRMADMAKSGELAKLAKSVSDGIVATGQAIAGVVGFVKDYGEQILVLARAYAVFKGASALASFAKSSVASFDAMSKSTAGATGAVGKFRAAAANIGQGVQFAALTVAVDFTVNRLEALVSVTQEYLAVQADLRERQAELVTLQTELGKRAQIVAEQYRNANRVQLASEEELRKKTRIGMQEYIKQLEDAIRLNNALRVIARAKGDSEAVNNLTAGLRDLNIALDEARAKLEAAGGSIAAATGEFARKAVKNFQAATDAGRGAAQALAGVFEKLDLSTPQGVKELVETLQVIGPRAKEARAAIEGELVTALQKLSGEQLRTFQLQAAKAFQTAGGNAKDLAAVMNGALGAALTKLGVGAGQAGIAFTESGKDMIATFRAVTENAQATSAQITAAFNEALSKATTKQEAEALGAAIKSAGETGKVGIDQAKDAATTLALRLREIAVEVDPLADQFARFGVTSKAELEATRDAAERFYLAVVDGARNGKYAQDDVRAAFQAYAEAARAAVANSTQAARQQVEAQIAARAAALGVTDALGTVGAAGQKAGSDVAAGADRAAAALDDVANAAEGAADSAGKMGASADTAADGLQRVADAGREAAGFALDMSAKFANAAASLDGLDRVTFALASTQQREAQVLLDTLRQQNAAYDENAQRIEQLRRQFTLLGDAQLQQLAREQQLLEQNLKRRQESAEQQRTQQQEQRQNSQTSSGGAALSNGKLTVEVVAKAADADALANNPQAVRRLTQAIVGEIQRSGRMTGIMGA